MDAESASESNHTTDTELDILSEEGECSEVEEEERSANMGSLDPYQFEPWRGNFDDETGSSSSDEDFGGNVNFTGRGGNTNWCTCGHCVAMENSEDCLCCKEISFLEQKIEGRCCLSRLY